MLIAPSDAHPFDKVALPFNPLHCWDWTAATRGGGYGTLKVKGRMEMAHRHIYEMMVGPIPDGMVLDHLCRRKICVNPAHLEPVTIGENTRRGMAPSAIARREDRCMKGHVLSENYYELGRGCRICRNENGLAWYYRKGKDRRAHQSK